MRYSGPRIEFLDDEWLVYVQKPERTAFSLEEVILPSILYVGIIIIYRPGKLITVSREYDHIFGEIYENTVNKAHFEGSLTTCVLYGFLDYINNNFDTILVDLEVLTFNLQIIPNNQMPSNFLEAIFHLKRETSIIESTLFHLTEVLNIILNKKRIYESKKIKSVFSTIYDEAYYLTETAGDIHGNLVNIIDLPVNAVYYGMNRAMKVIAALTAIVIIPQVVGGLLGMNLIDVHGMLFYGR